MILTDKEDWDLKDLADELFGTLDEDAMLLIFELQEILHTIQKKILAKMLDRILEEV
jgi:hypothetical protein